jgi:hypothetical protein
MSKPVVGDPKIDQGAIKALTVAEAAVEALAKELGNQKVVHNLSMETLVSMEDGLLKLTEYVTSCQRRIVKPKFIRYKNRHCDEYREAKAESLAAKAAEKAKSAKPAAKKPVTAKVAKPVVAVKKPVVAPPPQKKAIAFAPPPVAASAGGGGAPLSPIQ